MKIFVSLLLLSILNVTNCNIKQKEVSQNQIKLETASVKNILIVYLSRTKNTETVAKIIQKQVGGKLVQLELVNPYPENYKEIVAQVDRENKEEFLPELKTKINDLERYDTVFIGFPTWDM